MRAISISTSLEKTNLSVIRGTNHRKMEENIIELYPKNELHSVHAIGGALTQASGYVFKNMKQEDVRNVIHQYFDKDGANYKMVRIPIDSCDFSTHQYSAASTKASLEREEYDFSIDEEYIFPYLDLIEKEAGRKIPILLSPWSPQSYLKTNNSRLKGGSLKKECYQMWAHFVSNYAKEYLDRGYAVVAMTIQNEPNAVQTWDSCLYSAEEEREYLLSALKPELEKAGLADIKIFYWDHNKERLLSRARDFINEESRASISGIAFHGYCGDHFEALSEYRALYPEHEMIMSEFCMGVKDKDNNLKQLKVYSHEILNDLQRGANAFIDWNMILDAQGGPNHVGNYCMASFMTDENFVAKSNMAFEVMKEVGQAVEDGSSVIFHTKYDSTLDVLSVKNRDGNIHVIIGALPRSHKVNIRINECVFTLNIKSNSLTHIILEEGDYEQN